MTDTAAKASISVVIPAYNERSTIRAILARVKAVDREKEIIVVDDGSTDGTRTILREYLDDPEIKVIMQPQNQGKGSAIRTGFREATKDVVIVQDADEEYDPGEYDKLCSPIERGLADVVYGSRFQHGIFYVLIHVGGRYAAYALAWVVVFWYILFYPSLRRKTDYYLRRRFPGKRSRILLFRDRFRLAYNFAQVLIDRAVLGFNGPDSFRVNFPDRVYSSRVQRKGFIPRILPKARCRRTV